MKKKLISGGIINNPIGQWYLDSLEELSEITNAFIGFIAQILTENGLRMLRSASWVDIRGFNGRFF